MKGVSAGNSGHGSTKCSGEQFSIATAKAETFLLVKQQGLLRNDQLEPLSSNGLLGIKHGHTRPGPHQKRSLSDFFRKILPGDLPETSIPYSLIHCRHSRTCLTLSIWVVLWTSMGLLMCLKLNMYQVLCWNGAKDSKTCRIKVWLKNRE